jgi:peptide-methionine (S)-S-oxide reductase
LPAWPFVFYCLTVKIGTWVNGRFCAGFWTTANDETLGRLSWPASKKCARHEVAGSWALAGSDCYGAMAQSGRSWIFTLLHRSASLYVFDGAAGTMLAPNRRRPDMTVSTERAVLAGGCFWGVQDLLRRYPGVISTRVGYTGGEVPNATYRNHGNHAEAIEITFDPQTISYRKLLEFFFQIHDPSTLNRQGNDRGASYRSAIFYTGDDQKRIAEDTIADVDASGLWPGKVVTEVAPAGPFWEAEPEHQDYLEKYPDGYTCHFIRPNWTLPHRAEKAESSAGEVSAA